MCRSNEMKNEDDDEEEEEEGEEVTEMERFLMKMK